MARIALEIPRIGLVMENARIVRWLKQVGDAVRQGEAILELETEKSVVEVESSETGTLVEILLPADREARVGDRVAWLETAAGTLSTSARHAGPAAAAPVPPPSNVPAAPAIAAVPAPAGAVPPARTRSSPAARRLASQHGIDLRGVGGSGPRGRIQLSDVSRAIADAAAVARADAAGSPAAAALSSMRRAMARAMTLSNATVPQFIVESPVDWTSLQQIRLRMNARLDPGAPRITLNDFLAQAMARALRDTPALNATFSGDAASADAALARSPGTHVGLVVAVEDGVLVPVLHDVDRLGMAALADRRARLVERALQGRLRREELEGATASISNLGRTGPERFTAMINPPQSAILAVGREREAVCIRNGGIHLRPLSQLTLTVDHRVADGRLAAQFLARLIESLESDQWRFD